MRETKLVVFLVSLFCLTALTAPKADIQKMVIPWGRETLEGTRGFFSTYKNILIISVEKQSQDNRKPPKQSTLHFKGQVVKVYSGAWEVGEKISFVHYTDGPVTTGARKSTGQLMFVLTNQHSDSEFALDTGDFFPYREELKPALDYFYPAIEPDTAKAKK